MSLFEIGDQEDSYKGKTLFFFIIFLFIEIIMIAIFVPNDWVIKTIHEENQSLVEIAGYENANNAWKISQGWYNYLFVDSGITSSIRSVMFPTEQERTDSLGLEEFGKYDLFPWIERRGDTLSMIIQQAMQRAYVAYEWVSTLLWLCIPAIAEGIITRAIKKHNFDYPSPIAHRYSVDILQISIAIFILSLLVPLAVSSLLIPILFVVIIPIVIIVIISNLPKSI